jgi:hypothetical protein
MAVESWAGSINLKTRAKIIAPALKIRREGYGEPVRDYKQELRDALKE